MNPSLMPEHASPGGGGRLAAGMLAWLIGVAGQLTCSQLAPVWCDKAGGVLVLLLALLWGVWPRGRAQRLRTLVLCIACSLSGGLVANAQARVRQDQALPASLEGQNITVQGVVATLPQVGLQGVRFVFEVDESSLSALTLPGASHAPPRRLALGWYSAWGDEASQHTELPTLRAGERWQLTVRLRQPHGVLNPHGFDRELNLFEQGVRATGTVRRGERLQEGASHPVQRWRQRIRDGIEGTVADPRAAGVLAALAVGDQGAIEAEDWTVFRLAGVAHLMSISGLHVTMFAWLAAAVVGSLWRRSTWLMGLWPAPWAARWGGVAAAAGYAVFSGWGVPAQRTLWMLAVVTLLTTRGLRWPWPWVLLAAAVVVTAWDPWALLQPGFWLSFMAVALLMMSPSAQTKDPMGVGVSHLRQTAAREPSSWWRSLCVTVWASVKEGARTQWIATWGLAPLSLVFFQQVSVVGLIANGVAIPVVTLLITPLALLGALWSPLWSWGAWCVQQLNLYLGYLAAWPVAVWSVPVAPWWAQLSGLLAGCLWMVRLPWTLRALAVPLVLPLLWPAPGAPPPGHFEVLAADVGQGTAVLIRTAQHLMVFDAGPTYSRESDAGQRVLLPLLQALGHDRIDRLVLSHRDSDHVGGALPLLRGVAVASLWSSVESQHPVQKEAIAQAVPTEPCHAGQQWQWDGVRFEVLHPQLEDYARQLRPNAMSCVVKVSAAGVSVLLTGDIEKPQEAALVAAHGDALASTVLLVPHHGSRTSSTSDFLAAVQPEVAVVQSGYRNRFGHPAPTVSQRYAGLGIAVRTSPDCGAWRWRSDEAVAAARCERQVRARYWHWRPEGGGPHD